MARPVVAVDAVHHAALALGQRVGRDAVGDPLLDGPIGPGQAHPRDHLALVVGGDVFDPHRAAGGPGGSLDPADALGAAADVDAHGRYRFGVRRVIAVLTERPDQVAREPLGPVTV